jgi:hypothetical protein
MGSVTPKQDNNQKPIHIIVSLIIYFVLSVVVCNCPKGAANLWGFCDVNTGQCCKPGGNCTICPPNYILTPSGCEFCGECVGRLLDTAQGLDKNITIVLDYLKKGAAGLIAQAKYKDLNETLNK